jgi:hypothetical protein
VFALLELLLAKLLEFDEWLADVLALLLELFAKLLELLE